jgi:class 3 adenylate cyclase/tetratricopeptide (TPR) repeat protein
MTCPRCQREVPATVKFCGECGARLDLICSACQAPNPPANKFCHECGTRIGPKPAAGPLASPESYTPKHLAEKILTSKTALEGERKLVTVLFGDLKGSMELLADRDPEEARKLLDPVLERMMEAVHRYEGTVNQVMGDGIMALFGAPLAHEDHAVRACYAALRMQESVVQYAEGVFRSHGVPIQIRVGLNSGEVVVRAIGSDLQMDYSAVGQTTHLAARMEQMATPGTILIAAATLQLAEGYVEVTARGPVAVKGLPEPVEIYALTGASALRTRLHAAAARGLTRFVGRDAEIEQIHQALALAHDGHGQLVALVGEPGVGKSRLIYECTHSQRTKDWLILEAGSVSYGKATGYLPVIDLLKGYFKVHDRETHGEIREKVTAKLRALGLTLEPMLPALLTLLDVPVEDTHWRTLDPAARRQRTLEAVKHLLLRESQLQPVLLVFEDLHWIDAETQAVLDVLVDSLLTARVLLLVNYRPEYRHGWGNKPHYRQLRLDALAAENTGELLSAILGDDPALEPVKRLLIKRGNPFFIEEGIRTLVETGALAREHGAYRLTRPIQAIEVPATVHVILASRIDRLRTEDKQLLQTAAVIGKDVPLVLLHAVAEVTKDEVDRGLTRLQTADFLYETRLFPDPEYTFKHALTHEVTYGAVLRERRKVLHARIVRAIEQCYPDRLAEHVERLAHHAVRSEMWEQAVLYLRQAGAKALARSANPEAVACFEQALTAIGHLPETRETLEQAIDLRFDLRNALHPLGEFERIVSCLREVEGLARRLDDQRRFGQMSVYMCHNLWMTGHPTEAVRFGQDAQAIGESLGDLRLQVTGDLYLGAACLFAGDYRRAEALLRKVLRLLEGDSCQERFGLPGFPSVMARCYLTVNFAELGEFTEGIAQAQEGIRLAEALHHPYSLAFACWVLAHLYLYKGEPHHAELLLERGVAVSREWNLTSFLVTETGTLGYAHALSGRIAEGIPLLQRTLSAVETQGHGNVQALFLIFLGDVHHLAGRLEDALAFAGRALTFARERGQRGYEAWALRLLGEATARRDPPGQASCHYRDALALADELGMRPVAAHCHFGLGKLSRRAGEHDQAREHLTTSIAMYRHMDMRSWRQQAEAELEQLAGGGS